MTKNSILLFLKENKQLLLEKFQVKTIGLFGSYATGKQHTDSDIDLIVDMPSSFDRYYDLKEFLEKAFRKKVDLGLERSMRSFIKSRIKNEVIYV
ncbi:FIG188645: PAP/25A core domain:DNA polymerase, beta-like region [hydrothermal vent metagenome]|uniref:FIG188645: PAP/25A core domain:DNA polymerase, beta-like region n=1 Tax=hydrothermal vent metagenome TaxID=652676 RepID=A0A1W1C7K2_9ZZZZ